MSHPQESSTFNASAVVERSGSPAVMYGINATFAPEACTSEQKLVVEYSYQFITSMELSDQIKFNYL